MMIGFNPTLVRLRPDQHTGLKAGGSLQFQSHAGSIEAEMISAAQRTMSEFQSHAGSIEALGCSMSSVGNT